MLIDQKLKITDFRHSISSLEDLIRQLQCQYFSNAIKPALYRSIFSNWARQTSLLQKVLNFIHYIEIPNNNAVSIELVLQYFIVKDRPISEIWLWISDREKMLSSHTELIQKVRTGQLSMPISNFPYIWILDHNYENIAHEAVRQNNLNLLRSLAFIRDAYQINQRNKEMNSPCHLAVLHENFDLLSILINSPNVDLAIGDINLRTPLHLLLYMNLQYTKKRNQISEKHVSSIVCHMLSQNSALFFLTDAQGYNPIDYALLLGSIAIVSSIFTHHLLPPIPDYTPYFYQALRLNQPSMVNYFTHLYLNCDAVIRHLNTEDIYGQLLSDIVCYCIRNNLLKSLVVLLSKKQFVCSIDCFTTGGNHSSQLPLHLAIDAMKYDGRMEPFRILDKFNVHVNAYSRVERYFPCFSFPEGLSLQSFLKYLREVDCGDPLCHDNFYSYASSLSFSVQNKSSSFNELVSNKDKENVDIFIVPQETHAIALFREIFVKNSAIKCYFPNKSRKYQAGETLEHASRGHIDILSYFCNSFFFQCNPIVTIILSSQSNTTRYPSWKPYNQHSSHYNDTEIPYGYHLLEYLLLHTPFIDLINIQEARSCLTPLAAACAVGNKCFIEVLCRHGARPYTKLNSSYLSNLDFLVDIYMI